MIDKERIKAEAEAFFEWPSKEKTYVTTTSMLIFANVIAEMARAEEREACASICEQRIRNSKHSKFMIGADHEARAIVDAIRARAASIRRREAVGWNERLEL